MKKCLCVLILCLTGSLWAEDVFEDAVPADAVAYVFLDIPTYHKQLNTFNPILETLKEEGVLRNFLQPALDKGEEELLKVETENELDIKLKDVLPLLESRMAAVMGGAKYAKSNNFPALMYLMEVGDNGELVQQIIDTILEKLAEQEIDAVIDTVEIAEAEFARVSFKAEQPEDVEVPEGMDEEMKEFFTRIRKESYERQRAMVEENPLIFGLKDGILAVSNSTELLTAYFENRADDGAEGLAQTGEYRKTMLKVEGQESPLKGFLSVNALVTWIKNMPDLKPKEGDEGEDPSAEIDKIIQYGFSGVQAVGLANIFEDNKLHSRVFVSFPEEEIGIMRAVLKNSGGPEIPAIINQKAFMVAALKVDPSSIYQEVMKMMAAMDPQTMEDFEQNKQMMKEGQGIDIDRIINAIGGNMLLYMFPDPKQQQMGDEQEDEDMVKAGLAENAVFALDLSEPEAITTLLDTVFPEGGFAPFKRVAFMGETIFAVGGGAQNAEGPDPATPGFAIFNGRFVFASSGIELRDIIRRASGEEFKLSDAIVAALKKVDEMDPQGSFLGAELPSLERSKAMFELFAKGPAREGLEEMNEEFELGLDFDKMPGYEQFKKYLNVESFFKGGMIEGGFLMNSVTVNTGEKEE